MADYGQSRVYFIFAAASGLIKIGIAQDVTTRLRALQGATGDRLHLLTDIPGGRELEQRLHHRFSADRVRGEWFRPSAELLTLIRQHADSDALPTSRALASTALFSPGVFFLLGHKFSGKTYLALQIACALAEGKPSLAGIDGPTGGVLIVNVEDGAGSIRTRLKRLPTGPPANNVRLAFDFPTLTENFVNREEGGFQRLNEIIDGLPEIRLIVLDSWFALAGCWGRNTGTIRQLEHLAEMNHVSFLILHTPEFDNLQRGGDSTLSIIGAANGTLLLRRNFAQRRGDLIVASPELTAVAYTIEQDAVTGYWEQVQPHPRPLLVERRWWELREETP